MADNDDGRVESRLAGIGRGFSATPERIAQLQKQAEALAKQPTGKPERSFAKALGDRPGRIQSRREQFRDQRKAALPKKGPIPTGTGMKLKRELERDLDDKGGDKEVVLKA